MELPGESRKTDELREAKRIVLKKRQIGRLGEKEKLRGGEKMNKVESAGQVSNQTGLTKRASKEAIDAIISAITDALARGEKVTLVGFGTFQVMERKARRGRNPQTGEEIQIPAKTVPKFVSGKSLREAVQ